MAFVSLPFNNNTVKIPIIYLLRLLTFWNISSSNIEFSWLSGLHFYRQIFSEATSIIYCYRQQHGLSPPPAQLKRIISVYKTIIKCKLLLLDNYECCKQHHQILILKTTEMSRSSWILMMGDRDKENPFWLSEPRLNAEKTFFSP